jgi:hypothetical protein
MMGVAKEERNWEKIDADPENGVIGSVFPVRFFCTSAFAHFFPPMSRYTTPHDTTAVTGILIDGEQNLGLPAFSFPCSPPSTLRAN